jgi:periplasmic divalent cation tolerance protein
MAERPLELVLTGEGSPERAEALALALLERRLVACATLLPGRSLYRWQGRIENGPEVLLLLKTQREQLAALRRALHELHSYATPEWIHWSAETADPYASWLGAELSPGGEPPAPAGMPGGEVPAG